MQNVIIFAIDVCIHLLQILGTLLKSTKSLLLRQRKIRIISITAVSFIRAKVTYSSSDHR